MLVPSDAAPRFRPDEFGPDGRSRLDRIRAVVDTIWDLLGDPKPTPDRSTVSWAGIYEIAPVGNGHGAEPGNAMILGPHQPKPACSPIGLHGACGRAFLERRTLIVRDVATLGEGYIACDPRDRSELVIPLFEARPDGVREPWGVLDLDSFAPAAFSHRDAEAMWRVLSRFGLTDAEPPEIAEI